MNNALTINDFAKLSSNDIELDGEELVHTSNDRFEMTYNRVTQALLIKGNPDEIFPALYQVQDLPYSDASGDNFISWYLIAGLTAHKVYGALFGE